jgi:hypothetical protein
MVAIASRQKCMMLHLDADETVSQIIPALGFLRDVERETSCPLHHVNAMWIGPEELIAIVNHLKQLAAGAGRNILLVSGHYLEDQVTICCLEALIEGFDVHLLCDLISARDPLFAPVLQQRLFQAGVVPSSLRQFLYLWYAAEIEPSAATSLKILQSRYQTFDFGRPR